MEGNQEVPEIKRPAPPRKTGSLWRGVLLCVLLLCVEIYFLVYDFEDRSLEGNAHAPIIATLQKFQKDIRIRQRGTLAWSSASTGDLVRDQDSLLTLSDSTATLEFKAGGGLSVGPESLITVEQPSAKTKDVFIDLAQGTLHKEGSAALKQIAVKVGATILRERQEGSAFDVKKTDHGFELHVTKGAVTAGASPQTSQVIQAGENAVIDDGKVERFTPHALQLALLAPAQDAFYSAEDSGKIDLEWKVLSGADAAVTPEFTVAIRNAQEDKPFLQEQVRADSFSANLDSEKRYSVRILAEKDGFSSNVLEKTFTLVKTAPARKLNSSDDEAAADNPLSLEWKNPQSKTAKSVESTVEYAHDADFKDPLVLPDAQRLEHGPESEKIVFHKARVFYWRVKTLFDGQESFAQRSEIQKVKILPRPKIRAPKLHSPKVRVRYHKAATPPQSSLPRANPALLWSGTRKPAYISDVAVDLDWEPVAGASTYHLQIARDEDFALIVVDQKTAGTRFTLHTQQTNSDQKYYFRVSALDQDGTEGDFSSPREIEIEAYVPPDISRPHRLRVSILVGAIYHARNFTSQQQNPEKGVASGLVPAAGDVRLRLRQSERADWIANFSLFAEKGVPNDTNVLTTSVPLPLYRLEIGQERDKSDTSAWQLGIYGSNTYDLSWNGRQAVSKSNLLAGVFAGLATSQKSKDRILWSGTVAVFGLGAYGADFSGKAKWRLGNISAPSTRSSYFFPELEVLGRVSTKETSYGAALKIGYFY